MTMTKILSGKDIAKLIKDRLKKEFDVINKNSKKSIKLGSLSIGDNSSSLSYTASQEKLCAGLGVGYILKKIPKNASTETAIKAIDNLKNHVTGIIVQLPLPDSIDYEKIIIRIGPDKDVEGLHPENMGEIFSGSFKLAPCTPVPA